MPADYNRKMLPRRRVLGILTASPLGVHADETMFADAEGYERFMGRWSRKLAPAFADFANLGGQGRLLDAGSGTGALSFTIAARSRQSQVVGIDPSPAYAGYASSRNPFPDRVRFETGDAQNLPFQDGEFDSCVSLLVFNFIPDPARALAELRRVTKPKGGISAAVWDYGSGMQMLRIFWDEAVRADSNAASLDEKHMKLCRAGELARLWRDGGVREVRERSIKTTTRFESFADYWNPFLDGQGPAGKYALGLNQAKREELRAALREKLVGRRDGPFELTASAWAVSGRR